MKAGLFLVGFLLASHAYAHKEHHHTKPAERPVDQRDDKLKLIRSNYLANIKPIIQKACFDCHSNQPRFPWYYGIPGIKQLIDSDIAESKEHLDFSEDFPFKGHGSPEEDLKAIKESISDGDMPPLLYRIMHPNQKMDEGERRIVLDWLEESTSSLQP